MGICKCPEGTPTWVPTYCNYGHCAVCFKSTTRQHRECSWNGAEHESMFEGGRPPGRVWNATTEDPPDVDDDDDDDDDDDPERAIRIDTDGQVEQVDEGWMVTFTVWGDRSMVECDGSIDGATWELPDSDGPDAYSMLMVSGPGVHTYEAEEQALDELVKRLTEEGYQVELD